MLQLLFITLLDAVPVAGTEYYGKVNGTATVKVLATCIIQGL